MGYFLFFYRSKGFKKTEIWKYISFCHSNPKGTDVSWHYCLLKSNPILTHSIIHVQISAHVILKVKISFRRKMTFVCMTINHLENRSRQTHISAWLSIEQSKKQRIKLLPTSWLHDYDEQEALVLTQNLPEPKLRFINRYDDRKLVLN